MCRVKFNLVSNVRQIILKVLCVRMHCVDIDIELCVILCWVWCENNWGRFFWV